MKRADPRPSKTARLRLVGCREAPEPSRTIRIAPGRLLPRRWRVNGARWARAPVGAHSPDTRS